MERLMISCFKGLAPVSFPKDWVEGFDYDNAFAYLSGEARIRFPNGRAFGVSVRHDGPEVIPNVRELSAEEITETPWGPFCHPWEPYRIAKIFGHGPVTQLD